MSWQSSMRQKVSHKKVHTTATSSRAKSSPSPSISTHLAFFLQSHLVIHHWEHNEVPFPLTLPSMNEPEIPNNAPVVFLTTKVEINLSGVSAFEQHRVSETELLWKLLAAMGAFSTVLVFATFYIASRWI